MNVTRFHPEHLMQIDVQPAQAREYDEARAGAIALASHQSYTVRREGVVLAIGGVVEVDRDVGYLWSLLSVQASRHLVRLVRVARRVCEVSGKTRILAETGAQFAPGCRLLELLGFTPLDLDEDRQSYLKVFR